MQKFKDFIKAYLKTLLFFGIVGLVGGFFVGLYVLDNYPAEIQNQLIDELAKAGLGGIPADIVLAVVTALQSLGYGVILGAIGIFLGKKVGLWRDERSIEKKPLIITLVITLIGGLALILPDILFFAKHSTAIAESYAAKPTVAYLVATVTYGGIIEEVMLRLFMMSLVAFILHKLFGRGREKPAVWMLVTANIIAALLFAAGHLPTTYMLMGITPMILVRCFLLNGTFGLLFGWLYRKYGLRYAMISHAGCHVISKAIWLLFI